MANKNIENAIQHLVEANYEGNIIAVGMVLITKDMQCQCLHTAPDGLSLTLLGGVELLKRNLLNDLSKGTTPLPPAIKD